MERLSRPQSSLRAGRSSVTLVVVASLIALTVYLSSSPSRLSLYASHPQALSKAPPPLECPPLPPPSASPPELESEPGSPTEDGPGGKRWRGITSEFGVEKLRLPSVAELLTPAAPARSFYDALRKDLRYLTADSWSGMTGQFTSAIALIHLARRTQRVAIVPSWQDDLHYDDSIISMSLLFDLQGFRERTGTLVVEWADVKAVDPHQKETEVDKIGCYKGPNNFLNGRGFPSHNIQQTLFPRLTSGGPTLQDSTEALMLFDYGEKERLKAARAYAKDEKDMVMPENMENGRLLCYSSLWALEQASGGFSNGGTNPFMPAPLRGFHAEWWDVGQHVNFTQTIWDIAHDSIRGTMGGSIPSHIVTVHLRRGDFGEKCASTDPNCLPGPEKYLPYVTMMLDRSEPGAVVIVTTDESKDEAYLGAVDDLGWHRIDHKKLGTERVLRREFGKSWKWADAAVDQAILSMGDHFVGTDGSQVSWVSGERVQSWQGGTFALVGFGY